MNWLRRILDLPDDQPSPASTPHQLRQPDYSSPAATCTQCFIAGHTFTICQLAPCWRLAKTVDAAGVCVCGFPQSMHQGGDT